VVFQLVPSDRWERLQELGPEVFLQEGEVRLYRPGSDQVALRARLGEEIPLPKGDWTWIAEAPGYISTTAGLISSVTESEAPRTLVWKAEPACRISFGETAWQGVEQVDFVSLDFGAVFPTSKTSEQEMQIPAGEFLYYTTSSRGLKAISGVRSCGHQEVVAVAEPQPPPENRQDLLVVAQGQGALLKKTGEVEASFTCSGGEALAPSAHTYAAGWVAFFFRQLPADRAGELLLRHPEMRTERLPLSAQGGSVRELSVPLRERLTLIVPLEYLPKREHEKALLQLWFCGQRERVSMTECHDSGKRASLREGFAEVRFEGLDSEQILLVAEIDDELILGLGNDQAQDLRSEPGPQVVADPERLEEHHIFGHLLLGDKAVPGELRVDPLRPGTIPSRRFPTDEEDLFFHLFYFGQKQPFEARGMVPESLWPRLERGLFGLGYAKTILRACDAEGFCRSFHAFSTLVGDGRWDIDLGEERRWVVRVTNATTDQPLEGVRVLVQPPNRQDYHLHWVDGETIPADRVPGEAHSWSTDAEGRVHLLSFAPDTGFGVYVDGYQDFRSTLEEAGGGKEEITVALLPKDRGEGLRLTVAGEAVQEGVVVILREEGRGDASCIAKVEASGFLYLKNSCFQDPDRIALVATPRSQLLITPVGALPTRGDLPLTPRLGPPLEVRLTDLEGAPVRTPVGLQVQGLQLSTDLLLQLSHGGTPSFHITDENGVVRWPFLGSEGPAAELLLPALDLRFPLLPGHGPIDLQVEAPPLRAQEGPGG
jgi:hypothetical protein